MGDSLYISITKENPSVQEEYWWPLVFEAMHQAAFQFQLPGSTTKQGNYFSFLAEMDYVECTFQELWDVLYMKHDEILVLFWSPDNHAELFHIDVTVKAAIDGNWQLNVTLEDGYVGSDDIELNKYRIRAFLQACLALYELCSPCFIKMYWDEERTDLLMVRAANQEEALEPIAFCGQTLHWKKKASINQQVIYLVDPLPVHEWGNRFKFISLLQGNEN